MNTNHFLIEGKNYRQRELQGIASYPVSRNTFDVESFDRLQETKDSLLNALCNGE